MPRKWAPINAPGIGASVPSADADDTFTYQPKRTSSATTGSKPSTTTARAMTVRMDPEEADEVDGFVLALRTESGRRFDKSDMVRELIRLAREDPTVRRRLVRRLEKARSR